MQSRRPTCSPPPRLSLLSQRLGGAQTTGPAAGRETVIVKSCSGQLEDKTVMLKTKTLLISLRLETPQLRMKGEETLLQEIKSA